jgi:flagellar protein FliO/FliZ
VAKPAPLPEIEIPKSELPEALKDDPTETSMGWALFRTFVVLGLVIMIVWLSLNFGLRRLIGLKGPLGGASVVTVLERIPLDQKRALFVVKAAGEYLLLGSGDGNLGLVSKLDAAEVEKLMQRPQGGPTLSPFLARLLTKKNP